MVLIDTDDKNYLMCEVEVIFVWSDILILMNMIISMKLSIYT